MKKCQICGKVLETEDDIIKFSVLSPEDDTPLSTIYLCKECSEPLKNLSDDDFNKLLKEYIEDLNKNWIRGNKENSKPGTIIKIMSLKGEEDHIYFGKTGVIKSVDDIGQLHGTWGGLAVIPEEDTFLVLREERNE